VIKTRKRDRIFVWVMAGTFILTTVGVGAAVVWQAVQDSKANSTGTTGKTQPTTTQLKGTKLKDFTPVAKIDTLQVLTVQDGTGSAVKDTDSVTVDYTGAIASTGIIFESSLDSGQPFTLSSPWSVIDGWKQALPGMKSGGKYRILIPSALAYGATGSGAAIPANSDLVFDIIIDAVGQ
jgi:FKBP-type peptidyl-prolyl cis-trans isomerase